MKKKRFNLLNSCWGGAKFVILTVDIKSKTRDSSPVTVYTLRLLDCVNLEVDFLQIQQLATKNDLFVFVFLCKRIIDRIYNQNHLVPQVYVLSLSELNVFYDSWWILYYYVCRYPKMQIHTHFRDYPFKFFNVIINYHKFIISQSIYK